LGALEAEAQAQALMLMGEDHRRFYEAFLEKARPAFVGRENMTHGRNRCLQHTSKRRCAMHITKPSKRTGVSMVKFLICKVFGRMRQRSRNVVRNFNRRWKIGLPWDYAWDIRCLLWMAWTSILCWRLPDATIRADQSHRSHPLSAYSGLCRAIC